MKTEHENANFPNLKSRQRRRFNETRSLLSMNFSWPINFAAENSSTSRLHIHIMRYAANRKLERELIKNFFPTNEEVGFLLDDFYNSHQPRNIFITYRHNSGTCANLGKPIRLLLLTSCSRSSPEISSLTPAKTQQFIFFRYETFHNNDNVVLICLRMKTSTQHKFNILSTLNNFTGVIK